MRKGEATRAAILDRATDLARSTGVEGLSIGRLATELSLSKSGLFAHFGSKEALQVAIVEHAREQFVARVIAPGLKAARGEPRLRALFERWLSWGSQAGGCIFLHLAAELDDRPGPARDALAAAIRDLLDVLATTTRVAIDEGQFRGDVDPHQVAFELYGIMAATHAAARLVGDPKAGARTRRALDGLIARCR
ncbi:MAG: TetR/AcrR family transcriptional regulator [Kofleriaceae bacterium]|nr:TetR/AcrR family transcriptional regulator [Kofleriaceae bacterium]MCL4226934.1 TetR/AcrR family transcriptional regulator [Myxococcales bacterium]